MIVALGAVERTREGILDYVSRMIRRSIEASGVPQAELYTVERAYYRRVISEFTRYANDLGRENGLTFTEAEIEGALVGARYVEGAPGIAPTFGPRVKILHEAVDYSLSLFRVVVTPTGPASLVSDSRFEQYVDHALQNANQRGAQYGYSYRRQEIALAIIERGYLPPAVYATATPTVTRTFTEPPTATERVRPPSTATPVYPTPTYPETEREPAGVGKGAILTAVGLVIGGLALMRRQS